MTDSELQSASVKGLVKNSPFFRFGFRGFKNLHSPARNCPRYNEWAKADLRKEQKMNDSMMSAGEVIKLIGCGRSTFYKWIRAQKFPQGQKINGLRKWWKIAVLAFLNGGNNPSETPPLDPAPKPKRKKLAKHIKKKDGSK